jgi:hypothetical protein
MLRRTLLIMCLFSLLVCVYSSNKMNELHTDQINRINISILELAKLADINNKIITKELDLSVLNSIGIITDGRGHGSCVAIGPNLILTAAHCLEYENLWVEIGGKIYMIVDTYTNKEYDVGLVRIRGQLPYLELGEMPELLDKIYVVGAPENIVFENNISQGVVTNLGISWDIWTNVFMIDATAWWGNSGGPVLNIDGKVIGILVGGPPYADSIGLCESVDHIIGAVTEFEESRKVEYYTRLRN